MVKRSDLPIELAIQMAGPVPFYEFESDGCTWSPDFIGGCDLRPAGVWHDYAYWLGGDEGARELSDRRFYRNLRACGLGRFLSAFYFRRVRWHGVKRFTYRDHSGLVQPHMRPRGWQRLKLLFTRWLKA